MTLGSCRRKLRIPPACAFQAEVALLAHLPSAAAELATTLSTLPQCSRGARGGATRSARLQLATVAAAAGPRLHRPHVGLTWCSIRGAARSAAMRARPLLATSLRLSHRGAATPQPVKLERRLLRQGGRRSSPQAAPALWGHSRPETMAMVARHQLSQQYRSRPPDACPQRRRPLLLPTLVATPVSARGHSAARPAAAAAPSHAGGECEQTR